MKTLGTGVSVLIAAATLIACGPGGDDPLNEAACGLLEGLERPAEAYSVSANGISANGISANGISANKLTANKLTANRLTFNRLTFNRLTFNRLTFNRLTFNRLTFNRLTFNGSEGDGETYEGGEAARELAASAEGRELLTYVARCALDETQTLTVEVDGEIHRFPGVLGVVPEWVRRPLTDGEERWLSACLLAHVNAFGVSVPISLRGADVLDADAVEQAAFPIHEGAFFGSLAEGKWFACHGEPPEVARALSADRDRRVCTDPDSPCEIRSVGACADVCETFVEGYGWTDCTADGATYGEVVNGYLREDALVADCGLDE